MNQSQQEIQLQVLNATHPLVSSLIGNRHFRYLLTADAGKFMISVDCIL